MFVLDRPSSGLSIAARRFSRLQQELYPEIAVVWGLVLSLFLQWEAERLQPPEIFIGVIVTIVGAFVTRMLASSSD